MLSLGDQCRRWLACLLTSSKGVKKAATRSKVVKFCERIEDSRDISGITKVISKRRATTTIIRTDLLWKWWNYIWLAGQMGSLNYLKHSCHLECGWDLSHFYKRGIGNSNATLNHLVQINKVRRQSKRIDRIVFVPKPGIACKTH